MNNTDSSPMSSASPVTKVVCQYIQDLSIENPNLLKFFAQNSKKDVGINYDLRANKMGNDNYQLLFDFSLEIKGQEEKKIYVMQMTYVGIFVIKQEPEKIEQIILINCAEILFPFIRQIVTDATAKSGISPISLDVIDFRKLYLEKKQKAT